MELQGSANPTGELCLSSVLYQIQLYNRWPKPHVSNEIAWLPCQNSFAKVASMSLNTVGATKCHDVASLTPTTSNFFVPNEHFLDIQDSIWSIQTIFLFSSTICFNPIALKGLSQILPQLYQ